MSDLRRWPQEGATEDEVAFLEHARRERPHPSAHLRTLNELGISAPPPPIDTAAHAASTAGSVLPFVKLAAAVLLTGGLVTAVVLASGARVQPPAVRPPSAAAPEGAPGEITIAPMAPSPPPDIVATPGFVAENPRKPRRPPVAAKTIAAEPPAAEPTLAEEVSALEDAQRALAARDTARALRALDRYRLLFPSGKLASEETVLRVRVSLARGDREEAVALAEAFYAAHPDSPYVTRVRELVRGR